jgi:transcriptional regulator with XRE-family HTH domain
MDTAALIRDARYEAAISQRELARRAGITSPTLSRFETGQRQPPIRTLTKVLAAAGKQVRAELEPLDEDIRRAIAELENQPIHDRPAVLDWSTLTNPENLPHRVEGLAAAAILGAPVPVDRFDLALADEDATFEWLSRGAMSWVVRIKVPSWAGSELVQQPADQVRQVIERECQDGVFEIECLGFVGHVTLRPSDVVARHTRVEVPKGVIPVQPMHEIESSDPRAKRVFAVLRDETPAPDAAPPGTALAPARSVNTIDPRRRVAQ